MGGVGFFRSEGLALTVSMETVLPRVEVAGRRRAHQRQQVLVLLKHRAVVDGGLLRKGESTLRMWEIPQTVLLLEHRVRGDSPEQGRVLPRHHGGNPAKQVEIIMMSWKVEGAFVLGGPGCVAEGIPGCRGGDFRAAPAAGGGSDPDAVLLILLRGSSPLVVSGFRVQPPSFEAAVACKVENLCLNNAIYKLVVRYSL